ncbi:hypothetical protein P9112_003366 [Eukaryota sp. TZLM1-RC]
MWELYAFLLLLIFFHVSEFSLSYYFHPTTTSKSSWLISTPYVVAMILAFTEYFVELTFFTFKTSPRYNVISVIGLFVVILADAFRKLSIITAGRSFTHQIAVNKSSQHSLVTSGIYAFSRHPSYFAWFWWSIGTQILLKNPLSCVAYAIVSWRFFADRIPYEEQFLVKFFGQDYISYRNRVPTRIPFIK